VVLGFQMIVQRSQISHPLFLAHKATEYDTSNHLHVSQFSLKRRIKFITAVTGFESLAFLALRCWSDDGRFQARRLRGAGLAGCNKSEQPRSSENFFSNQNQKAEACRPDNSIDEGAEEPLPALLLG
jgi:hypothetical protein